MPTESRCPQCKRAVPLGFRTCGSCGYVDGEPVKNAAQPIAPLQRVSVVDIDMPFGSMVVFMVKWAFASIPAIIVIFGLLVILAAVFGVLFGGLLGALSALG